MNNKVDAGDIRVLRRLWNQDTHTDVQKAALQSAGHSMLINGVVKLDRQLYNYSLYSTLWYTGQASA